MAKIDQVKLSVKQNKKFLKWIIVLWAIVSIVLIAPVAYGIYLTNENSSELLLI